MQGLYIYAVGCFVLGLVFMNQGDVILGALVCAAGPFWLHIIWKPETMMIKKD